MDATPLYLRIGRMQNVSPETLQQCVELLENRFNIDGSVDPFLLTDIITQITANAKWQEFGEVYKYVMSRRIVLEDMELIRLQKLTAVLHVCEFLIRTWERVCRSLVGEDVYVRLFSYLREDYRTLLMVVYAGLFKSSPDYPLLYQHALSQIQPVVRDWEDCKKKFRECFKRLVSNEVMLEFESDRFEPGFKLYGWMMYTLNRDLKLE